MSGDPVYYRVMHGRGRKPQAVCMQWFDEFDYDQDLFINKVKYDTVEEAMEFLEEYEKRMDSENAGEIISGVITTGNMVIAEEPTMSLKFIDGILHQLWIVTELTEHKIVEEWRRVPSE